MENTLEGRVDEVKSEEKPPQSPIKFLRRFSSIKVNFEKEKRKTLSKYQQQGLRVSISVPKFFQDKREVRKRLRASVERYSAPELYVKMICALFPNLKAREMPDSNALIQHLKQVFRISDQEHSQRMDIARATKLPQRIINLEIVEARNIPAKDTNGLSDPFCVVYLNTRDVAQRTKVVHNSLNPVWKQYFTFKVNDPNRDVLYLEIMDYNEEDEPLRDRIKKFKEIKSPSTLGVLLKEIANARSVQELIGSLRIPVSEISSETIEKWFKLKNHEDRGEVYMRMALGYNKSKEAATEEFLQILQFLLVHELDRDPALSTPFHWDENYEMWSKYILRQFKWQGGLKPKDIVLAKWRAYTTINAIFPLNANMLCLLMDAVLERIIAGEYDSREISRFWECTTTLANTIFAFLADIHDVLPCPVTVLHTYHMLKTLELLTQFVSTPDATKRGSVPFMEADIIHNVVKAVRDGADKFYLKVFSDTTSHDDITGTEDPLLVAMESLLKMGQILHEDLRLAISTIHADFKGILNVDYLRITYTVYDEQYGKLVKHIVEEYNNSLFDRAESEVDDTLDEDSTQVKVGLAVFKLYMAVKGFAELAPANYLEGNPSEFSLRQGFHNWFFHSIATWIDILRKRIMKWVKNSVSLSEEQVTENGKITDAKLSKMDVQDSKEIPISPSAIDTAQMFLEIHKFWVSLGWEDPQQSYVIVRKLLEELYDYLIYYASELNERYVLSDAEKSLLARDGASEDMHLFLYKACTAINNINYVKEQVELLSNQLNVEEIIKKLENCNITEEYEDSIAIVRNKMTRHVRSVIMHIIKSCVKLISRRYTRILQDAVTDRSSKVLAQNNSLGSKSIIDFLDSCLITLHSNLDCDTFRLALEKIWSECLDGIDSSLETGLEGGKSSEYFKFLRNFMHHLRDLFWPSEVEPKDDVDKATIFKKYDDIISRLSLLELPLEELKVKYYERRHLRQMATPLSDSEHGAVALRAGYVEKQSLLLLELLNARNLKSYDSNNLSDPYAVISVAPKEYFPNIPSATSKVHKESLFPLFDETFEFTLSKEDMFKSGFVVVTLYDYDFLGRDDLMGEVLLPFSAVRRIGKVDVMDSLSQLHLALTKPVHEDLEFLARFEERSWDKEAMRFAKVEKDKIEKEAN